MGKEDRMSMEDRVSTEDTVGTGTSMAGLPHSLLSLPQNLCTEHTVLFQRRGEQSVSSPQVG